MLVLVMVAVFMNVCFGGEPLNRQASAPCHSEILCSLCNSSRNNTKHVCPGLFFLSRGESILCTIDSEISFMDAA